MTSILDELDRTFGIASRPTQYLPPTEVLKTDSAIVVRMDVPGIPKDEIDIRFRERHLIVSGQRARTENQVYSSELWSGEFTRRIAIRQPVNVDNIQAEVLDGVLTVTLPILGPQDGLRIAVS